MWIFCKICQISVEKTGFKFSKNGFFQNQPCFFFSAVLFRENESFYSVRDLYLLVLVLRTFLGAHVNGRKKEMLPFDRLRLRIRSYIMEIFLEPVRSFQLQFIFCSDFFAVVKEVCEPCASVYEWVERNRETLAFCVNVCVSVLKRVSLKLKVGRLSSFESVMVMLI